MFLEINLSEHLMSSSHKDKVSKYKNDETVDVLSEWREGRHIKRLIAGQIVSLFMTRHF